VPAEQGHPQPRNLDFSEQAGHVPTRA